MEARTWVLVGILFWVTLCCAGAALGMAGRYRREAQKARAEARTERERRITVEAERDTVMQRHDARVSHFCVVRDEEIERLNREIGAWQKKYRILEQMLNRMWEERK